MSEEPLLGLATTRELLHELEVRATIGCLDEAWLPHLAKLHMLEYAARYYLRTLPEPVLAYRTVDS